MNEKLEEELRIMEELVRPEASKHEAFIQMTKLMKMFYEYLEDKANDS
jgi:hypothetical protein